MEVDRARAQEQLRGHLSVAETAGDETGDLHFLRGQLISSARVALACRLATRSQLTPRALGPGERTECLEAVERDAQVLARLDPAARAAEELAERELGTRALERPARVAMRVQREAKEALGLGVVTAKKRAAAQRHRPGPSFAGAVGPALEHGEPGAGRFDITAADRSLDPVRPGPQRDRQLADLARTHKCLVPASVSELKCQHRPARGQRDVHQIPRRGEVAALSRKRMTLLVIVAEARYQGEHREHVRNDLMLPGLTR
jgi:hypothetical protein